MTVRKPILILATPVLLSGCLEALYDPFPTYTPTIKIENSGEVLTINAYNKAGLLPQKLENDESFESMINEYERKLSVENTASMKANGDFAFPKRIDETLSHSAKYVGDFAGESITVDFKKNKETYRSTVEMPLASQLVNLSFNMNLNSNSEFMDASDTITVTWDNNTISEFVVINFEKECLRYYHIISEFPLVEGSYQSISYAVVPDTGQATISGWKALGVSSSVSDSSFFDCEIRPSISRENFGEVDSRMNGRTTIIARNTRKYPYTFRIKTF